MSNQSAFQETKKIFNQMNQGQLQRPSSFFVREQKGTSQRYGNGNFAQPSQPKTDILFEPHNLSSKLRKKKQEHGISIEPSIDLIKFLNNNLEVYLKNTIQSLIGYSRRRNYSYDIPFKNKLQKTTLLAYNYKNEITSDNKISTKYYPFKKCNIIYFNDNKRKIELIEKYKQFKENKKRNERSPVKQLNKSNDSDESMEDKKEEIEFNIFSNSDVTRNLKIQIPNYKKKMISLQDLISFLETNERTPLHRLILQKAYIKMTTLNKQNE